MLPYVLVFLFAQCAYGVPLVNLNQIEYSESQRLTDPGTLVSRYVTDGALEIIDGGDTNVYILTSEQILNDLANLPGERNQALAVAQTLAILGELSTGRPGDSCVNAALIDAYARLLTTGDDRSLNAALGAYVARVQSSLTAIVNTANNPAAQRFSTGQVGSCSGEGRVYQFESAWDGILASVSANSAGLINEQYCAARRLYNAFNARSNNVGAAITAASIPQAVNVFERALVPLVNFLRVVASGANASAAAAQANVALANAVRG